MCRSFGVCFMDISRLFSENFFSFAAMLSGAPGGGAVRFSPPSIAASSGLPYAGENYAIFTERASAEEAAVALSFFSGRHADFIAPVMPETPGAVTELLYANEILHRETYTSMYLPLKEKAAEKAPCGVVSVPGCCGARWGNAVWRAFGGEGSAGVNDYERFGAYLVSCRENSAFALEIGGKYIATALLHESKNAVGLYYFATLPEERRRGHASALMDGVTAAVSDKGKPLVLLATKEGLPFYLNCGFVPISEIPILSRTADI